MPSFGDIIPISQPIHVDPSGESFSHHGLNFVLKIEVSYDNWGDLV